MIATQCKWEYGAIGKYCFTQCRRLCELLQKTSKASGSYGVMLSPPACSVFHYGMPAEKYFEKMFTLGFCWITTPKVIH